MHYIGLDVHARQSTYCVLDEGGRRIAVRTVRGPFSKVIAEMAQVKKPFDLCFEACTGYGFLYDALSKMARRVVVAHPGQLRLIFRSRRKCDRLDAERLAKLLYLGEVPPAYVPAERVRAWRTTIGARSRLVARRTALRSKVRALLRSQGIEPPRSLWSRAGTRWLRSLAWPSDFEALGRDVLMEELDCVAGALRRVEKALDGEAARRPGVMLLMTAPGVGPRTAEAVAAYVDNPDRFARNEAVGAYFGMVPCQDSSAGRERLGHITRQGPGEVRRLLVEAAWQSVRRSAGMRAFYERVMNGDPDRKKTAIVACAHKLARCMHAMLRENRPWSEQLVRDEGQCAIAEERQTA